MSRSLCRIARSASRSASLRPAVSSLVAARSAVQPASLRSISTTLPRFEATSLSAKLQEELKFEEENEDQGEPQFLTDFKSDGVWTVVNEPGADEVILTRSYGNESIRLIFSISDLDAVPEADEYDPEAAPPVEEDGEHGPTEESFPVETAITITKPGVDGALTIDAVAQDGLFTIQNISFYQDAGLALGQSGEDDWKRQGLYMGPAFDNLDEGVQAEFESFLDERGINSSLALFIPDLAEFKEQKEYVSWLKSVNSFIEA